MMTRALQSVEPLTGKHNGASRRILAYLRENPNIEVPYTEIREALDLPEATISNGVTHLISAGVNITRPMRGIVLYRPTHREVKKEVPKLYEYIGTSGGETIVRGEDNELYRIVPLFER